MIEVGIYLKTLRSEQHYTQQEVGDAAGVTDRAVAAWEKGRNVPTLDAALDALKFLKGAWEDVVELMSNDDCAKRARDLAKWRLKNPVTLTDDERALLDAIPSDQRKALFEYIRTIRGTP